MTFSPISLPPHPLQLGSVTQPHSSTLSSSGVLAGASRKPVLLSWEDQFLVVLDHHMTSQKPRCLFLLREVPSLAQEVLPQRGAPGNSQSVVTGFWPGICLLNGLEWERDSCSAVDH